MWYDIFAPLRLCGTVYVKNKSNKSNKLGQSNLKNKKLSSLFYHKKFLKLHDFVVFIQKNKKNVKTEGEHKK